MLSVSGSHKQSRTETKLLYVVKLQDKKPPPKSTNRNLAHRHNSPNYEQMTTVSVNFVHATFVLVTYMSPLHKINNT